MGGGWGYGSCDGCYKYIVCLVPGHKINYTAASRTAEPSYWKHTQTHSSFGKGLVKHSYVISKVAYSLDVSTLIQAEYFNNGSDTIPHKLTNGVWF